MNKDYKSIAEKMKVRYYACKDDLEFAEHRLKEATSILRDLEKADPTNLSITCMLCYEELPNKWVHKSNCPWLRAKQFCKEAKP